MFGFDDRQLKVLAELVEKLTPDELAIFEKKADLRLKSYERVSWLINENTHPAFRFGNVEKH